jgi:hypothetical protein
MVVEVCYVLGQHCLEVAAVDDQHSVEYLAAEGADPSFGDRVRAVAPAPACAGYEYSHWRTRHRKRW